MKKFILAASLFLGACAHTPPPTGLAPGIELPTLPTSLAKKHGKLPDLTDPSMGASQEDGAATDRKYNDVAHQSNTLVDLWNCAKDALKNKTNPKTCLDKIVN